MVKSSRGIFFWNYRFCFFFLGEGGGEVETFRAVRFYEPTVRHITFKRLKVGRRVRCSVLDIVFLGEKRRVE